MIQLNGIPLTCWVRQKVYTAMCFIVMRHKCVTKLWQIKIFLASSGKCEVMLGARQDRSSSQSGAKTPANLNKEGRRGGGVEGGRKEVRGGERRHDWAPLQRRHSLQWYGVGKEEGFYFAHKEIISPSNCLQSSESQPNHSQLLQHEHVMHTIFGYF